jgi:cytochrome c556
MKPWLAGSALAAVVCAGSLWAATAASPAPQQIVDDRVAGMKSLAGNIKGAATAATPDEAKAKFAAALKFAETVPGLFPKGTGIGDKGVTKTRAVQDIWTKSAKFKAVSDALVTALKAAEAAPADKSKLGAVTKTCKDCHDAFRGPETE